MLQAAHYEVVQLYLSVNINNMIMFLVEELYASFRSNQKYMEMQNATWAIWQESKVVVWYGNIFQDFSVSRFN